MEKQACANSDRARSDNTEHGIWSGANCWPPIQQYSSTGHKMDSFKFQDKYGKELKHQNILGKYGTVWIIWLL